MLSKMDVLCNDVWSDQVKFYDQTANICCKVNDKAQFVILEGNLTSIQLDRVKLKVDSNIVGNGIIKRHNSYNKLAAHAQQKV